MKVHLKLLKAEKRLKQDEHISAHKQKFPELHRQLKEILPSISKEKHRKLALLLLHFTQEVQCETHYSNGQGVSTE